MKNPRTHESPGDLNVKPEIKIEKRSNGRPRVRTINAHDSRTQQQFKKDCDVNLIIAKFKKTGSVTHVRNAASGVYADMTNAPSYQDALQTVINAENAFQEIPAKIRERFGHDPAAMMQFLADPANDDLAIKLGLKVKREQPKEPIQEALETIAKNTTPPKKSKSAPTE